MLRTGQTSTESRSTLSEELGHHELGHVPVEDETEVAPTELWARRWAAVRLISVGALAEVVVGANSIEEVSEALEVDRDLLEVRVRELTNTERAEIGRLLRNREKGV